MAVVAPDGGWTSTLDPALSAKTPLQVGPPRAEHDDPDHDLARQIVQKWDQGQQVLADQRRSYWQNLAFYLGRQWVWWSDSRQMVMPIRFDRAPGGPNKARLVINRFGPNLLSVVNRLTKSELAFEVTPSDSSDPIVGGAKMGEKLLESSRVEKGWDAVRFDENLAKLLGGTAAVGVEWDGQAGDKVPMYDDGSDVYVGTGDCRLRSYNITEFVIEPGVRDQCDARYWITNLAMPVATAQDHYGLSWVPRPDAETPSGSLYESLLEGTGRRRGENLCAVYTYYERPLKKSPGMYAVVINNTLVYKGPWPFPFTRLNVRVFRQKRIDGRWYGGTFCDDAVPIQTAYNFARSVLTEHMKLASRIKLFAPIGSFDEEDLHGPGGELVWYAPDAAGNVPQYGNLPQLSRWISQEPENLREELDNVMHVHDISRGIGFSRASGQALSFLSEQDDSGLGHMVWEEKHGWEFIARMVLELYGAKVTETRTTPIRMTKSITQALKWTGRELQGQTAVNVPLDAVTPRNAAARAANAKDLWDRKIVTDPRIYARMSGLPSDEFSQLLDPDAAKANDENLRMMLGIPVLPDDFDDHGVHIAEHNDRLRKTDAYLFAPPEVKQIIDDHIDYHEKKAANEVARQQALAAASPGAQTTPQASAPPGSDVPQSEQEMTARMGMMASLGAAPDGTALGGGAPGGGPPPAAPGPPPTGG